MTSGHGAENRDQAYAEQDAVQPFDQSESAFGIRYRPLMKPALQDKRLGDEQHDRE